MKVALRQILPLAGAAAFLLAASALMISDRWRYAPPPALGLFPSRSAKLDHFEAMSGLKLPTGARVLVVNDGHPLDGTTGFLYWTIYSEGPISMPSLEVELNVFPTAISDHVRVIENAMFPFKIEDPQFHSYHTWEHGDYELRVNMVTGPRGYYLSVHSFKIN